MYKLSTTRAAVDVFISEKVMPDVPDGAKLRTSRAVLWTAFDNWAVEFCGRSYNKTQVFAEFQNLLGDPITGSDGKPAYRVLLKEREEATEDLLQWWTIQEAIAASPTAHSTDVTTTTLERVRRLLNEVTAIVNEWADADEK